MDKKYKKHQLRDHIYELPGTYIGSIEVTSYETYIYDETLNRMVKKNITYVPGLYKIYDEIVVNALDQVTRLKQEQLKGELENIRHVKNIKFNIDRKTGYIEIENDGDGVDIDTLPEQGGIYIPQMIFGELLTSTNYTEKEVEKLVGGLNGYGSKLTNIFSLEFTVETVDHRRKKIFTQTWKDNMKTVGKPSVKAYSKVPYTKIRFLPDYKRFGLNGLTDDIYELFHKRALDACATSDASVAVYFNDKKLEIKSFEKYADLFLGDKNETTRVYESCGERWEVIAAPSASAQFEQVSFVNGINTVRGGKHVDYIKNQISKSLAEMAESKKKTVKPQHIVDNLFIIVKCLVVNPSFDTQTKEALTTPISKFGSKCELSQKFMTALYKSGIIEKAVSLTDFHQDKKAAKTDGKKTSRIIVEKLDDANEAGTKNSEDCTLILTEGDSAKALAISGLSIVGRAKYGVFPLRGKVMNVKDATAQKIADNKEITDLKKILGLQNGKVYKDLSELRYGRIMIMCDADSVTGDTPLLLRNPITNMIEIKTIEDLTETWSSNDNNKEYGMTDYEVWTDTAWTKIKHVMRHKVDKEIYRVLTHTGIVDVTEDHSLLDKNAEKISPKDIKVNGELLHNFPIFEENKVSIPDNLDILNFNDLCKIASECKIQYYQTYKKDDLITELNKYKNKQSIKLSIDTNNSIEISNDEAWVMGLFWADGTAGIYSWDYTYKNKNRPRAYTHKRITYSWAISNCDITLLEKAKDILASIYNYEFKIIADKSNNKKNSNCNICYKLIINGCSKTQPIVEKYINLFYYKNKHPRYKNGNKYIPAIILNAPRNIREQFLNGYYSGDGSSHDINNKFLKIDIESKISSQCIFYLCKSLGYEVSINHILKKRDVFSLNITKGFQQDNQNRIKKIFNLGKSEQYVYDLETENHHFQAGIGQMIVHNTDGHHIKGLLFNLFQSLWSSLYKMDNFLVSLKTPMIKAISATETVSFYTMYDAEKWIENKKKTANGLKGWTFKYYKGLGTSTAAEAKEYFKEMKITEYKYTGKDSDEALDLAFNKKRADDRKEWLMNYNPSNVLDYSKIDVKYEEFIHKELIAYSNSDLIRSINHMCDGLKDSTRKILYAAFKRKLFKKEMKVAQFGAYTAEVSDYHHGEQSLFQAIIGMAQNYVCSNNINLFAPNGQFGTRIKGGTDASAPRYIYTLLTELAQLIYPVEDFKVLEYNISDEGKKIEPKYYVPVIPMVLVNGAQGIGTGFSTNLPCYNPTDIIAHCRIIANALNTITIDKSDKSDKSDKLDKSDISKIIDAVKIKELTPWYLGFKGKIESKEKKEGTYESHGVYKWLNDTTIHVTELPIGTWTEDYKEFLEQCIVNNNPVLKDYEKHFTETNIDFTLKLYPGVRQGIEMNFDTEFKLVSTKNLSINNIHLFTENDTIKKYANTSEIIKEFSRIRFIKYHERKEDQLKTMRKEYQIVSAKVRFIKEYINGTITLVGKKIAEVEAQLKRLNYPAIVADIIDGGDEDDDNENESSDNNNEEIIIDDKIIIDKRQPTYDYLTDLPLKTLTVEKKTALEKQENNIKMRIEELENKTLSSIWLDELSAIETAWNSFKTMIEKTHSGDHSALALSSSSVKKRTPAKKK